MKKDTIIFKNQEKQFPYITVEKLAKFFNVEFDYSFVRQKFDLMDSLFFQNPIAEYIIFVKYENESDFIKFKDALENLL